MSQYKNITLDDRVTAWMEATGTSYSALSRATEETGPQIQQQRISLWVRGKCDLQMKTVDRVFQAMESLDPTRAVAITFFEKITRENHKTP